MRILSPDELDAACEIVRSGGVLAYPTESVFGLGCDPLNEGAILQLLKMKQRDWAMGLLLIASDLEHLKPFIDWKSISEPIQETIKASWPGSNTWIVPCSSKAPQLICGRHRSIGVRIPGHPLALSLCNRFDGAIVSTSANIHGLAPARSTAEVRRQFRNSEPDGLLDAPVGGALRPSAIRVALTGQVIRE